MSEDFALRRFSSLSARLVLAVLATATIAFSASLALTFLRLDQGLERQAVELGRLSEEKLGQKLEGEARLAGAQLVALFDNVARRLESIAQRADVAKVVASANVVPIWELLGQASQAADIDGILVVDAKLRVFGANRDNVDIVATNQALQSSPLAKEILPILSDNDRKHRSALRRTLALTQDIAQAVGAKTTAPLATVVVEPIFDDFGDVFAALIAYRSLRPAEQILKEFSNLEGAGLMVLDGDHPISSAGLDRANVTATPLPASAQSQPSFPDYWSRCTGVFEQWRICALAPVSELHDLRNELVRIGEVEGRSLAHWLIAASVLSLVLFVLITLFVSRRISLPLARITEAVSAVARGDWKVGVAGADRNDEVGDIARAVSMLQRSLEERDRLRSDVAQAESVKKRREALEDAIKRFDRVMRSVLLSVSDCAETMDETARDLARMSAVAEGEAVETAFVSENTVSNFSTVRSATERLSVSISETVTQINQTAEVIDLSSSAARAASMRADDLTRTTKDIDAVIQLIGDVAAQTNALALNATIQASHAGVAGESFANVISDIRALADRIANANDEISGRMSSIRGTTDETVELIHIITQKLEMVFQQTRTIALAVERQDAVTREIASSMSAAASGTINVSSSVGRLKSTIEEARGASAKVVTKAADMADEAHRLDSTVKSFLREVTA
ncbi:MAG TPA: methyl-accepting chemotaxis protein [Xanthobacteraceae bacterium]|jgi:methyl-accepting chemotaxis protein|nr:methyl-accepting chemotaxis protein [Xanthobacteraceae bacterium]